MTSVAIFVEGQTELVFVEQLLFRILGYQKLRIVREEQHGGIFHDIGVRGAPPENAEHTVLLSNCSCDGKVLPAIEERAELLRYQNYDRVIGLRDIYPEPTEELTQIYDETNARLALLPLPCEMVIAVREMEAWFLADSSHFARLHSVLTAELIYDKLGVDISNQDVEQVRHPADQLDDIYRLVGRSYDKKLGQVHAVVSALDYEYLYLQASQRAPEIGRLIGALDAIF